MKQSGILLGKRKEYSQRKNKSRIKDDHLLENIFSHGGEKLMTFNISQ